MIPTRLFSALFAVSALCAFARAGDDPHPVSGTVLDALTRQPLPRYTLELRDALRLDRVTSDERGRFTSAIAFPPGDLTLRPIDDESVARTATRGGLALPSTPDVPLVLRFDGAPIEVAVPTGPTIRLTWKTPAPEGSPTTVGTSVAYLIGRDTDVDEGPVLTAAVRVEPDGQSWVRFASVPPVDIAPARLRVVAIDGLWQAEADLRAVLAELTPTPVKTALLEWNPCARWSGALDDGQGRGVPGTWVTAARLDPAGVVLERRRTRCDIRGRYAFDALEPGRWRLAGRPLRFEPFESEVRTLAAGESGKLAVHLRSASPASTLDGDRQGGPIAGRIVGIAVVEGAPPPPALEVVVRRAGEPLPQESHRPEWRAEDGHYVAVFAVPDLPVGEYELQLVPPAADAAQWSTLVQRARAGSSVTFTRSATRR